jgi:2-polyprenyl-6-methoxyphenol hydroxylase-like FAD-dependent oxidoreductase
MGAMTDVLNRLFSLRGGAFRPLLGFGMQIVDRIEPLKTRIVREAAGVQGEPPSLLRRSPSRSHNG